MFRYRFGYPAAVLTALICLAGAACSAPGSSSSSAAAGGGSTPSGPIKIAVVDAQSGTSSDLGQFEYRGVKLAVDRANAAGGVDGRKIALSLLDDQGDPTVGTELARKIASRCASGSSCWTAGP
jgi:branched-chain amino acid transport system substrate-binding protein